MTRRVYKGIIIEEHTVERPKKWKKWAKTYLKLLVLLLPLEIFGSIWPLWASLWARYTSSEGYFFAAYSTLILLILTIYINILWGLWLFRYKGPIGYRGSWKFIRKHQKAVAGAILIFPVFIAGLYFWYALTTPVSIGFIKVINEEYSSARILVGGKHLLTIANDSFSFVSVTLYDSLPMEESIFGKITCGGKPVDYELISWSNLPAELKDYFSRYSTIIKIDVGLVYPFQEKTFEYNTRVGGGTSISILPGVMVYQPIFGEPVIKEAVF